MLSMSRYVDADEILRQLKFVQKAEALKDSEILGSIIKDFEKMQEHIVRCKDCKRYVSDGGALIVCDITGVPTADMDFCSFAERKGEGNE